MKKILITLILLFGLFLLQMIYMNYRLEEKITKIHVKQRMLLNKMERTEKLVFFANLKLKKLENAVKRPLFSKPDYILVLKD